LRLDFRLQPLREGPEGKKSLQARVLSVTPQGNWLRDWGPAIVMFIAATVLLGYVNLRPVEPWRQVAVLLAPGTSIAQFFNVLGPTGARLVRLGLTDAVLVVDVGTGKDAAGFRDLRAAGALAVFNPYALGGCLTGAAAGKTS
jgi:hypothetical protein